MARITPRLIRVSDGASIWSEGYETALVPGQLFQAQSTLATAVTHALTAALGRGTVSDSLISPAIRSAPTNNPAAYDEYLLGKFQLLKLTPDAIVSAIDHLLRAVEMDSSFAEAWGALARAYGAVWMYGDESLDGVSDTDELFELSEDAAHRAIRLDSTIVTAFVALTDVLHYRSPFDLAARMSSARRALEVNPNNAEALTSHAYQFLQAGLPDSAVHYYERAIAMDPVLLRPRIGDAYVTLVGLNDPVAATRKYNEVLDISPSFPGALMGLLLTYVHRRMLDSVFIIGLQLGRDSSQTRTAVDVFARMQLREATSEEIIGFARQLGLTDHGNTALFLALGGFDAEALEELELAYAAAARDGDGPFLDILSFSVFDGIAEEPRFQAILDSLGRPRGR